MKGAKSFLVEVYDVFRNNFTPFLILVTQMQVCNVIYSPTFKTDVRIGVANPKILTEFRPKIGLPKTISGSHVIPELNHY
jgi:hypothetical protein